MRKTILTVLLIVLTTVMYSQNRLGYTFDEVHTEFNETRYDMSTKKFKKDVFIQISQGSATTLFTFNKDSICYKVNIKPKSETYVNQYIDLFNERYEEVSHHKWNGVDKERKFRIILDDGNQFIFTKRKR